MTTLDYALTGESEYTVKQLKDLAIGEEVWVDDAVAIVTGKTDDGDRMIVHLKMKESGIICASRDYPDVWLQDASFYGWPGEIIK